jgi:hypothetical protein
MSTHDRSPFRCSGPLDRRSFMQVGLTGMATLVLAGVCSSSAPPTP